MKTLYKTATIVALLGGLAMAVPAATVIGSWQNNSGDGWLDAGNTLSITNTANTNRYRFVSGVVAGYAQSLQVNQNGWGNDLYIDLAALPGGKQAFLDNHLISFTFSAPPSGGIYTSGWDQMYSFALNTSVGGYTNVPWSLWTGNGGSMPNFGYYGSFPGGSITVTWDYSGYLANNPAISNSTYIQITFTGNTGGGAPTNFFMNNVVLSGFEAPSIIVDQFNPTNNPYAGTNVYAEDSEITNVYNLWTSYGGNTAVDPTNIIWDATQNCTNTPNTDANSGAMKFICNFTGANQFVIWNRGPGNILAMNPPITNGYGLLTFEFDVKYDPSSQTWNNGGVTNFGNLEWGVEPTYDPLTVLGSVQVLATNTGWVHMTISLTNLVNTDPDLQNITGIFLKQYAGYGPLNGTSILWLDNLKFTYMNVPPVIPPPIVAIEKAVPALRIFAGSTANTYDREELATVDGNQSWVGGSYPVSYSFTLLSYPNNNINQTHIFLVPAATAGQNMYANQFIEYQATNMLWLVLAPNGAGRVTASVQWKTNQPNFNPTNTVVQITNSTAIGAWTLAFNSATTGTLTAPGASPVAFSLPADVAALFANPLTAYFGLQPNSTAGEGLYEDWASITVTGVAGTQENEDFTKESSDFDPNTYYSPLGQFRSDSSALRAGVIIVRTNLDLYWVNWTLPAVNFALGTKTNLLETGPWINPAYYSGYFDQTAPRGAPVQLGTKNWVLLPTDDLPTVNGLPGGVLAPTAFFLVATNVVSP